MNSLIYMGDLIFEVALPNTARDVLQIEGTVIFPAHYQQNQDGSYDGARLMIMTSYLASIIMHVQGGVDDEIPWSDMSLDERLDWLDCEVMEHQQLALLREVVRQVSIPQDVLDEIEALFEMQFEGGCECPACKHGKPYTPAIEKACKLTSIPSHVSSLASLASPSLDEPVLDAPYWLHQVKQRWVKVKGRRALERIREQNKEKQKRESQDRVRQRQQRGRGTRRTPRRHRGR